MSWEAVEWANKQRLRTPQEQLVLLMIANAADPEGVAFCWWKRREHWWTYLVEHTRISRRAIFRHLKTIEELGLGKRERIEQIDGSCKCVMVLDFSVTVNQTLEDNDETQCHGGTGYDSNQCHGGTEPVPMVALQEEESSESKDDDTHTARARGLLDRSTWDLTKKIAEISGIHDGDAWPAAWATAAYTVDAWLREGYLPDDLKNGTREAMAKKRDGPPHSIEYFKKPWAKARGRREAPVLKPEQFDDAGQNQIRSGFVGRIPQEQNRQFGSANERRFAQAFDKNKRRIEGIRADAARDCGETRSEALGWLSKPEKPA